MGIIDKKKKVIRKWLFQCAYWRVCESCALKDDCQKEMKTQGIAKDWIAEQIDIAKNGKPDDSDTKKTTFRAHTARAKKPLFSRTRV
ncbi:Uncharacterised protein [Candidatus Norongarragalina meridionalis]|nr:Uncharacterised protein [Candidatus Norongarragalina meridionalis]